MSSKELIGSRYYERLANLADIDSNGKVSVEVVKDNKEKIGCYFCLKEINNEVLVLKLSENLKDKRYFMHRSCYNLIRIASKEIFYTN